MTQHKQSHRTKWHDMTCHVTTNHCSSPHVNSQPTTLLHLTPQATSWHQNRSHHHHGTAEGYSKEMVWASRWSVALRAFYRQILSLLYRFFPLLKLPPPARAGTILVCLLYIALNSKNPPKCMTCMTEVHAFTQRDVSAAIAHGAGFRHLVLSPTKGTSALSPLGPKSEGRAGHAGKGTRALSSTCAFESERCAGCVLFVVSVTGNLSCFARNGKSSSQQSIYAGMVQHNSWGRLRSAWDFQLQVREARRALWHAICLERVHVVSQQLPVSDRLCRPSLAVCRWGFLRRHSRPAERSCVSTPDSDNH